MSFSHESNSKLSKRFCCIVERKRVLMSLSFENDRSLETDVAGMVHKYLYVTNKLGNAAHNPYGFIISSLFS